MEIVFISSIMTFIVVTLFSIKYFFRHKYPVRVTCWFCGENTKVAYDHRNCWDCPSCEQYNGFDKDGGYNKPIPAQYDDRLNRPIRCEEEEFIVGGNILCKRCTQNQEIKIKQFANFTPFNEKNFDEEFDAFKRHTERVLSLCPTCEVKVQEVIKSQDEELKRRRSHLEDTNSFINDVPTEQTYLHSSYSETYYNKSLVSSIVLHTISLVCSVLLVMKEINLDGDHAWQKKLLFLHPALFWLDVNAVFLAMLGLMSFFAAKLFLGKYRLYKIDVVSCIIWILVTLSQTGFLQLQEIGSVHHMSSLVLNCFSSAVSVSIYRKRRDRPNISVIKMQMDNSFSEPLDYTPTYSIHSQVNDPRTRSICHAAEVEPGCYGQESKVKVKKSHDQVSEGDSRSQVTSTTGPEGSESILSNADNMENSTEEEHSRQPSIDFFSNTDLRGNNEIDRTATVLNAFSLGKPSLRRNDSGFSSMLSQGNYASNLSKHSVSENLRSRKQGRSVLSPATFKHESTPNKHRSTPIPVHGLFSVPNLTPSTLFMNRSASPIRKSAFTPTQLFSTDRHSFTPERPASPVTTSFGERPFPSVPLQNDTHSLFSSSSPSFKSFQNKAACGFRPIARQSRSHSKILEDTDSEDDCFSGITTNSKSVHFDSSTDYRAADKKQVAWWVPGLVGFALGGSLVGNVVQILMSRCTQ